MYKIELKGSELRAIKAFMKKEKNIKIYRRLQSLIMKNEGIKNTVASKILGVTRDCLTDWFKLYSEGGLEKLMNLNYGHNKNSRLDKHQEDIKEYIKNNEIKNSMEINNYLEKEHGLSIDNSWLVKYLKKNSIFPIRRQN